MEEYLNNITSNPLFKNIDDILHCLSQLTTTITYFQENQSIIFSGQTITQVGIILEGDAIVYKEHINGEQLIISNLVSNDLFSEAFLGANHLLSPISIKATTKTTVLFIDYKSLHLDHHYQIPILKNLLEIISLKSLMLTQKLMIMQAKTLQAKILLYLELNSQGQKIINIPFNHEQFAQYLGVDRSSLSRTLSLMKKNKQIDYYKNMYEILKSDK